jgi:hypothetical protein
MSKSLLAFGIAGLLVSGCAVQAEVPAQKVGSSLNTESLVFELVYENDFSADDKIDFETVFVEEGKRKRLPDPGAEWIAEGWGGAEVCNGKLWVAPAAFEGCGQRVTDPDREPSHMVVWNKAQVPGDMMFEFTVNHHGSDNGLTLVIFAAEGLEGQGVFDLVLPPRNGVYKNYHKGRLSNYTVSYWSRNKKPSLVAKGEQFTNRIRKNPGMHMLATNGSLTDKCNDCNFKVRILKVAGNITFEVNGVVANHVKDSDAPHGGGYIGLRSMQGVDRVSYDDFRVWSVTASTSAGREVSE